MVAFSEASGEVSRAGSNKMISGTFFVGASAMLGPFFSQWSSSTSGLGSSVSSPEVSKSSGWLEEVMTGSYTQALHKLPFND